MPSSSVNYGGSTIPGTAGQPGLFQSRHGKGVQSIFGEATSLLRFSIVDLPLPVDREMGTRGITPLRLLAYRLHLDAGIHVALQT